MFDLREINLESFILLFRVSFLKCLSIYVNIAETS